MRQKIIIAVLVLLASLGVSIFAWWSLVSPAALGRVPGALVRVLNVFAALVGVAYGRSNHGSLVTAVMRDCDFCSPREHMVSYFSAALPAYLLLFGVAAVSGIRRRSRRKTAA